MGALLRGKIMAVCTTEGSSWMGAWVSSAKAPSRCRYGQSNKGRTCRGSEGRPEPPSPVRALWIYFALEGPPSHPTSLILGFCPPPPPRPTLGRSWTSWSCRNCWCSRRPGEYLPLSPALQAPGHGSHPALWAWGWEER